MKKNNNKFWKTIFSNVFIWVIIIFIALSMGSYFNSFNKIKEVTYTEYKEYIDSELVQSATITGRTFEGMFEMPRVLEDGLEYNGFSTILPEVTIEITDSWNKAGIDYNFKNQTMGLGDYLIQFSPWLLIILFWFFIIRRMSGGSGNQGGIFNFSKSKAKLISADNPEVTFKDVAGCDEAKVELKEIVSYLKSASRYKKVGAKIPKGALLLGPPGTGKTLLAKAVSGEAKVPFFSISGAEFVEMFVGVGASRVRDLFEQAKNASPSIIFIDEIDAVGRHRGAGLGGGHDEREQTLNQILVEMDGFGSDQNVILLAATNRPDVLDKALLRPGRFDRQIVVDTPSMKGREQILKIHAKKIKLAKDVNLLSIAKSTPGMVGADLENLVNEAALLAARENKSSVSMKHFEEAKDKVVLGVERKSMVITEKDRKITAYHEGGHAIVAHYTKDADPIHKVTIVPRGRALGVTAQLPVEDKYNYSKNYLLGRLDILMGGRCAEQLIFNDITTGAGNDIAVATDIAKKMVCEWGMSSDVGPLTYGKNNDEVFLGKDLHDRRDISDKVAENIDNEITNLVKQAEINASNILEAHMKELHCLAENLLEYETVNSENFEDSLTRLLDPIPKESIEEKTKPKRRRKSKTTPLGSADPVPVK